MIRNATPADAEAICAIYNPYILGTVITFEETPVDAGEMRGRIEKITRDLVWLVHDEGGEVLGYAYATKWRERAAYRHSVETSVYVRQDAQRRGIGQGLYRALIAELRRRPVRAVIAGVALPNEKSVGLHEAMGFRKVAHFPDVGHKFGRWIDVGYWQLSLEAPPV
jgi:phosphinothricin acetyltransferase